MKERKKLFTTDTNTPSGPRLPDNLTIAVIVWWVALLLAFILINCSPAKRAANKLRHAEKDIRQAEALGAKWGVDSVKQQIAIEIPEARIDTVFRAAVGDTVRIENERQVIKFVNLPGDSVYIDCKCKPKVIYKTVTHHVTKTINAPDKSLPWWVHLLAAYAVIVTIWILIKR